MKNQTIDDIVICLDQIVADCKSTNCTLGYFAILYRRVTHRVKAGMLAGEFEDNARMERLVVLSELVGEIKAKMGQLSPAFGWLMPLAKKMDEKLVSSSIQEARDGAGRFAGALSLPGDDEPLIADRDQKIYNLGYCLVHPNRRLQWLVNVIGWLEWRTVADKLALLEVAPNHKRLD